MAAPPIPSTDAASISTSIKVWIGGSSPDATANTAVYVVPQSWFKQTASLEVGYRIIPESNTKLTFDYSFNNINRTNAQVEHSITNTESVQLSSMLGADVMGRLTYEHSDRNGSLIYGTAWGNLAGGVARRIRHAVGRLLPGADDIGLGHPARRLCPDRQSLGRPVREVCRRALPLSLRFPAPRRRATGRSSGMARASRRTTTSPSGRTSTIGRPRTSICTSITPTSRSSSTTAATAPAPRAIPASAPAARAITRTNTPAA